MLVMAQLKKMSVVYVKEMDLLVSIIPLNPQNKESTILIMLL